MPRSEAAKRAQEKYRRKAKTYFSFALQNKGDADVIAKLKSIDGSRTDYIRQLIREDIEEHKKTE